jgi:roadblock/LC7 domain-containing protein
MSEFDELVARDGVLFAGRFGPDWSLAEHKSKGLFIENPAASELAPWFAATITMMFKSMALAMDRVGGTAFGENSWQPEKGWVFSGGDYTFGVLGRLFVCAETEKVGSFDELRRLLLEIKP